MASLLKRQAATPQSKFIKAVALEPFTATHLPTEITVNNQN